MNQSEKDGCSSQNQRVLELKRSISVLEYAMNHAEPDALKMMEITGKKLEIELVETFRGGQTLKSTGIHREKMRELERKLVSLRKEYEETIDEYECEIKQAIQELYQGTEDDDLIQRQPF